MIRQTIYDNGYRNVAVYDAVLGDKTTGKRPYGNDWRARALAGPPDATIEPGITNTGILTDGLRAIDIDIDDRAIASDVRIFVENTCGETIARTRADSGRCLLVYRAADGEPRKRVLSGSAGKIEFLGAGQQFVAFGKHYASLAELEWLNGSPATVRLADLPAITEATVSGLMAALAPLIGGVVPVVPTPSAAPKTSSTGASASLTDVAAALEVIPNGGLPDWEAWNRIIMAIFAATGGSDAGLAFAVEWSDKNPEYTPGDCEERWAHYAKSPPTRIGAGTLFRMAAEAKPGWIQPSKYADLTSGGSEFGVVEAEPIVAPARVAARPEPSVNEATEAATAAGFAKDMAETVLYDHTASAWMLWDVRGGTWRRDKTGRGLAIVLKYVADVRALLGGTDKAMASISFAGAVERAAKVDFRLSVSSDVWDTDPMKLGVPGGFVDLLTGAMHPGDSTLRMSKQTSVAPAPAGTPTPLWTKFLHEATGGDAEYVRYLQRYAGYCLTALVIEEMVGFAYGQGGGGKGTLNGTRANIMGAYAIQMPIETFSANSKQNQEYARARMVGARMVMASETERGGGWSESALKEYSGNEGAISARQPYGQMFEYIFSGKILILGNHAPALRGGRDAAMERRLHIMPFDHRPAVRDTKLKEKLRAEYPGILRWMIDGCLEWQKHGLGTCEAVKRASAAYFEEQDSFGAWAAERLMLGFGNQEKRADLFTDYAQWARANGENPPKAKEFYETVERTLGLTQVKGEGGIRLIRGAAIRRDGEPNIPVSEFSDLTAILH